MELSLPFMDLATQLLTNVDSESICILFYGLQYRLTVYIVPRILHAFLYHPLEFSVVAIESLAVILIFTYLSV